MVYWSLASRALVFIETDTTTMLAEIERHFAHQLLLLFATHALAQKLATQMLTTIGLRTHTLFDLIMALNGF